MKSKIINRVRAREAHYQRKNADDLEIEQMWTMWANALKSLKELQKQRFQGDNHVALIKASIESSIKHRRDQWWWQFWK